MDLEGSRRHGGPDGWADEDVPRAQHAALVLGAARRELERGWTQGYWHVVHDSRGRRGDRSVGRLGGFRRTDVSSSCLVGAVLQAAWWYSDRTEHSAPAVDALWHELQERRGLGVSESIDRVCSPSVRSARMHDLIRWNDRPERTREHVLDLLDGTLTRLAAATA